jgi:hypothetical protein
MVARGRDRRDRRDARIEQRPFERLQPAHRAADHEPDATDPERVGERDLRADLVADRDRRKPDPEAPARGVARRRPEAAVAAPEHVGADDEVALGIERATGPEQRCPPAVGVGRSGQRVAHDHGVVTGRVQAAPGPVGEHEVIEHGPGLERERPPEPEDARVGRRRESAHAATATRAAASA